VLGPGLALLSYLLGSISFAEIVARRAGIDIRDAGSGNPGATNIGRVIGKREGRLVLVLDVVKGLLPAVLARLLVTPDWMAAVGFAATLGHCFPVWHRFRGGKGAATAAGVLVVLVPPAGIAAALTYIVLRKSTRRASIGSLVGALVGGAVATGLQQLSGLPVELAIMAWAIAALVLVRHHDNLARIWAGTEPPS
jgi:acyl phosphate:glycerol-3-phosphate acyltransferase